MNKPRYCIIGAGFCGLGVAKAFRDYGIDFDCLEKNHDLGGNWLNGVYDSTHIISSRDSTNYDDFPMPADYPDFPSAAQILGYLRAYADRFSLRDYIQFNTSVESVEPLDPKGLTGWRVRLSNGQERIYAGVVVANGHHWDKRYPNYPGTFTGKTLHSKDYKNTADFEGRRVLVVGAGNSGCDVAVEAALYGFESAISMRRGYFFLPKTLFGIPTAELDRPWLPFAAQKLVMKTALKLTVGSNTSYGLQKPDHDLFDHHPIVNSQLLYFLKHGRVQPKRDIARFDGKTVHFVDGTSQEFDTIVYATGFNVTFPFLDHGIFNWENGVPKRVAGFLPEDKAGLYVFGLLQPRGGAGPLISASARLLAQMVLVQEQLDHPIAVDFAKLKGASAKMLVGVQETLRQIRAGRAYLKLVASKAKRPSLSSTALVPRTRNMKFPFDAQIPKHWIRGNAFESHMANSLNLLFPEGERMFIRSLKPFMDKITDPAFKARVHGFMAQEVQHGREHERFFKILEAQGYDLNGFLKWYNRLAFGVVERVCTKKMRLSVTAAVEHYTAALAELVLRDGLFTETAYPVMRDLFRWHAIEEIEHKSVAYDVLQTVAPGYFRRIGGMLIATVTLSTFWMWGAFHLIRQDKEVTWRELWANIRETNKRELTKRKVMTRAFLQYFTPGFHPNQMANEGLALDAIKELKRNYQLAV